MDANIAKNLYKHALGELAANYLESLEAGEPRLLAESEAVKLIAEIKAILDDKALDDPACFRRIEAIVDAFHARGVPISRHDW